MVKSKRQRTREIGPEKRRRPRTLADIDEDLEHADCPLFKAIGDYVCDPFNKETSVRLMRHLIVEQVISADSIDGIVMAYRWLVRDWSYRPAYELYQAFLGEFGVASRLDPKKYQNIALRRSEEFKTAVSGILKAKVGLMLAGESPKNERRSEKRPRESLPTIPEEEQDTKEPTIKS